MGGMKERGKVLENIFFHNEEECFKAQARRNYLIGLWAAEKLGKSDEDAEIYAKEVVIAGLQKPGDGDVVRKIMDDFATAGIVVEEGALYEKMVQLLQEVLDDIRNG